MIVKQMVALDGGTVRRYTLLMNVTPEEEMPRMNSRAEIQHGLILRAEELAVKEGYQGPGKFTPKHYRLALAERTPSERAVERGFRPIPSREPSQQQRASKHYAEQITTHIGKGLSRPEAISRATDEHKRTGLAALHLPKNSPWAAAGKQEQRDQANRYAMASGSRIGYEQVKLHDAGPGVSLSTHDEKLRTARELLPRQVAAAVMHRGAAQPGQAERDWLDHWFAVLVPPPAPVAGGGNAAELAAYNRMREQFLDDLMEQARQLLRDPAERAKLQPTKLGG